jgi:outer membrane lipoprotein SlyB
MTIFQKTMVLLTIIALSSCSAMSTIVSKRNLDVQTKMSATIFLDPVADNKKTIFVQIRNTSNKSDFNIASQIKEKLFTKGYRIVTNPDKAHYILQANVLQVGKSNQANSEKSLLGGYGDAIAAGAAGALLGGSNGSNSGAVIGGIIGAGVTFIANAMVEDIYYSVTTDLQISEKAKKSTIVNNRSNQKLAQGDSGFIKSVYQETSDLKRYQTRILSFANKVNLKWETAAPELTKDLVSSIAGMF